MVETSEPEASDYEYEYDLGVQCVSGESIKSSTREVIAEVEFHTNDSGHQKPHALQIIQGKVDPGAIVSCIPLPLLSNIGVSQQDLVPSEVVLKGVSGKRLQNHGTVKIDVSCNGHQRRAKFYVTGSGNELLLSLIFCKDFELVKITETGIQRNMSMSQDGNTHAFGLSYKPSTEIVEAVHIMHESEVDYTALHKTWKKYLPLGKKTRDPLEHLKIMCSDMFDGKSGRFEGKSINQSIKFL